MTGRAIAWTTGAGLTTLLIVLFFAVGDYYPTILWWTLRGALFWLVPLIVLAIAVLGLTVWGDVVDNPGGPWALAWLVGIGGLVLWGWWSISYHEYRQMKAYTPFIEVSDEASPRFGQRAPYPVAVAQARPNLGNVPGDIKGTSYLPEGDRYTTLVTRRGVFSGYHVALSQTIPLTGRGTATTCEFNPAAGDRIGGWFSHNLGREIAHQQRWWRFDPADAYAYCDSGQPVVVVPLKRQTGGVFVVTERFAGVALYDGRTGRVEIVTDQRRIAALPGPAYPLSLATQQREATHALGDYGDWFFGRAGWDTTDKTGTDINSGNTAEFVLNADRSAAYVTPLTGRGSATSISALSVLRPTDTGLAALQVHRVSPAWVDTSAIDSRIKADYQDLPNWQNQQVMEITPLGGSRWVATIGNGQNVLYRVEGSGNLRGENPTCLFRADGTRIRCGTVVDSGGRGVGVQIGPGQAGVGDVASMSDREFAELLQRVNDEAARRLGTR